MKKFALIVAGGTGSRMKNNIAKQFIEINGRPILMHTIEAFYNFDPNFDFILVLPKDQLTLWNQLCEKHRFNVEHKIAFGGETRFQSVKNGLDLILGDGIVFIHDGVRPLVSAKTLQNCFEWALAKGNALPVVSVSESVRMVDGTDNFAVDRSKYFLVQTPQTFIVSLIKNAYQKAKSSSFTDDATVLESMGETIQMVDGNRENVKITYPEDLVYAEVFIGKMNVD
ncbi:2-C-methyl-D-erythritol 4-phosphate cytidylyltransferase [Draconibacterium sp.]